MTEKYRELRNENVKEINSRVRQFIHQKTGCELLFMENEDIEKVFTIVFRTPVENSTSRGLSCRYS